MKKILISMLLLVPILTGCANVDTKITINDDRSASVAASVSYEGDLSNTSDINALLIHENFSNYLDSGYSVDKAFNSKLSTIIGTKKVKDLALNDLDLSSLGLTTNLPDNKFIEYRKSFLVKSFNIDCTYDFAKQADKYKNIDAKSLTQNNDDQKGLKPEYYLKYADKVETETENNDFIENVDATVLPQVDKSKETKEDDAKPAGPVEQKPFTASISIQLPAPAFYNNADSVDGTLYTWNIDPEEPTNIKLQYVQYDGFAISIVILVGIVILILGAMKIIRHENQKRVGNSDNIVQ